MLSTRPFAGLDPGERKTEQNAPSSAVYMNRTVTRPNKTITMAKKLQTISGKKIAEPRLTLMAVWLAFLWIGLPILIIGGALDLAAQLIFGVCTGLWCVAG